MSRRLRLRRRLLIFSAPVVLLVLVAAAKMLSVAVLGAATVSDYGRRDAAALRSDAARLSVLNVIEPARAPFAAGLAAALDGRAEDADRNFTESLQRTAPDQSCPVRLNLELVREGQGDAAAERGDPAAADRYRDALAVVTDAPGGCFAGNEDPDPEREAFRDTAADRLRAKISALEGIPPATTPAAPALPPPPPPPPPAALASPGPDDPTPALGRDARGLLSPVAPDRLPSLGAAPTQPLAPGPAGDDPLDRLRQLLADTASTGDAAPSG